MAPTNAEWKNWFLFYFIFMAKTKTKLTICGFLFFSQADRDGTIVEILLEDAKAVSVDMVRSLSLLKKE